MCLIAFAWRVHPVHDLVLAANRDEFHARDTAPLHAWPDAPGVVGGRDRQAGGAWCAADHRGRFAAVTNLREPGAAGGRRSRGELVAGYLTGRDRARDHAEAVWAQRHEFPGFNLLVGDADDLFYLNNRDDAGVQGVTPGVHALSNGRWEDVWPKTERAASALRQALGPADINPDDLLTLLADSTPAPDAALPDTGVGLATERLLSPVFIRGEQYGTRASTVLLRRADGRMYMRERSFGPDGQPGGDAEQEWTWS